MQTRSDGFRSVSARPYRVRKTGCGTDGRGLLSPRPAFVSEEADTDTIRTKRTDTDGGLHSEAGRSISVEHEGSNPKAALDDGMLEVST